MSLRLRNFDRLSPPCFRPVLEGMRSDPTYLAFLREMGLKP